MLYHLLFPLSAEIPAFNVFRYVTARSAWAALTAFLISLLLGKALIGWLQRLKVGQAIRHDGPGMSLASFHFPENLQTRFGKIEIESPLGAVEILTRTEKMRPILAGEAGGKKRKKQNADRNQARNRRNHGRKGKRVRGDGAAVFWRSGIASALRPATSGHGSPRRGASSLGDGSILHPNRPHRIR